MAEPGGGSSEELTLRFTQEGLSQLMTGLQGMQAQMQQVVGGFKAATAVQKDHEDSNKRLIPQLSQLKAAWSEFRQNLDEGKASGTSVASATNLITTAFQAATSPLGILTIGVGAFIGGMKHLAESTQHVYEEMRQLQTLTGQSVAETEDLANTFQILGVSGGHLQMALYRLGLEFETGGKSLQRYGVHAKTEGEALLQLRQRISEITDSSARLAALQDIFGRSGRMMATAFALPEDQFRKVFQIAEKYTAVSDEFMAKSRDYARISAQISQAWEQVTVKTATFLALPIVQQWMRTALAWAEGVGVLVDKLDRVLGGRPSEDKARDEALQRQLELFNRLAKARTDLQTAEERHPQATSYLAAMRAGVAQLEQAYKDATKEVQSFLNVEELQRKKKAEEDKKTRPMSEADLRFAEAKMRGQAQLDRQRLEIASRNEEELARLETGFDVASVKRQMETNQALIADVQRRYAEELKLEEDFVKSRQGQTVDKETLLRLQQTRDQQLVALEGQTTALRLSLRRAEAAQAKQLLEEELADARRLQEVRLQILKASYAQATAVNKLQIQDDLTAIQTEQRLKEGEINDTLQLRLRALEAERAAQQQALDQAGNDYQRRREIANRLKDLEKERVTATLEANQQILQARAELTEKIRALGEKEASVGEQLINRAIANLQKRTAEAAGRTPPAPGKPGEKPVEVEPPAAPTGPLVGFKSYTQATRPATGQVSQQDILDEVAQLRQQALDTLASGMFTLEALQQAMSLAPAMKQIAQLGTLPSLAAQTAFGSVRRGLMGDLTPALPTGVPGGMGPYASLDRVAQVFPRAVDTFSEAVGRFAALMMRGGGASDVAARFPQYEAGTFDVPVTGPAVVHQKEMVVPAGVAEKIRRGATTLWDWVRGDRAAAYARLDAEQPLAAEKPATEAEIAAQLQKSSRAAAGDPWLSGDYLEDREAAREAARRPRPETLPRPAATPSVWPRDRVERAPAAAGPVPAYGPAPSVVAGPGPAGRGGSTPSPEPPAAVRATPVGDDAPVRPLGASQGPLAPGVGAAAFARLDPRLQRLSTALPPTLDLQQSLLLGALPPAPDLQKSSLLGMLPPTPESPRQSATGEPLMAGLEKIVKKIWEMSPRTSQEPGPAPVAESTPTAAGPGSAGAASMPGPAQTAALASQRALDLLKRGGSAEAALEIAGLAPAPLGFGALTTQRQRGEQALRPDTPGSITLKRPGRPDVTERGVDTQWQTDKYDVESGEYTPGRMASRKEREGEARKREAGDIDKTVLAARDASADKGESIIATLKPVLERAMSDLVEKTVQRSLNEVIRTVEFEARRN